MKHFALGSRSLLLDFGEDNLVSLGNTFSSVSDIFDNLGYGLDLLISSQVPLPFDFDAV